MRIVWSKKEEAVYIYLKDSKKKEETEKVSDYLEIDYSMDQYPMGIKILGVKELPIIEEVRKLK